MNLGDQEAVRIVSDTFIPTIGWDAGIPHYCFTEQTLRSAFGAFNVHEITRRDERVLAILAEKVLDR